MNTACVALAFLTADALALNSDDSAVREAAEARMAARPAVSLPAALLASAWPGPEVRRRAGRLLAAWGGARSDALAAWLFYGPSPAGHGRFLDIATSEFLEGMADRELLALAATARRWGLLGRDEAIALTPARYGWVNVVRHRAYGLPFPPKEAK